MSKGVYMQKGWVRFLFACVLDIAITFEWTHSAPKTDFCTFWLPASGANGFAYAPYIPRAAAALFKYLDVISRAARQAQKITRPKLEPF
jgi:hypothetical protein